MARLAPTRPPPTMTTLCTCSLMAALCYRFRPGRLRDHDDPTRFRRFRHRVRPRPAGRSEEHTSELQSLMRISYAVFCLKKKKQHEIPVTVVKINSNHTN